MRKLSKLFTWGFLLLGVVACKKITSIKEGKIKGTEWNPSVALPMIDSELSVYDILAATDPNELIVIDEQTSLLALVYEGQLFSFAANDIIVLPDTSVTESLGFNIPASTSMPPTISETVTVNSTIDYSSATGVSIETINLKAGTLKFNITPNYPSVSNGSITINVSIPGLTNNGVAFSETIPVTNLTATTTTSFDLTGYTFDMTNGNTTTNSIPIVFTANFNFTAGSVNPGDDLSFGLGLSGMEFSEIYGDFGQQVISTDRDSVLIRVFQAVSGGTFTLTNPKIRVDIVNSFGFEADIDFTTLETVLYDQDWNFTGVVPIQYNGQLAPFNFAQISAPTTVGDSTTTSLDIDNTNSNIVELMEPTPKFVHNEIVVTSNPNSATGNSNFATDESVIRVTTDVELPLEGYTGGWLLEDTIAFDFGDISFEYLDQVLLRANIDNWFPIDAKLQLIALDSNYVFLDSLLTWDNNLITSGLVDATGKVTAPTNTMTDFIIDEERANSLFNASYVVVKATAETNDYDNQQIVQLYEHYTMRVRVGIKIDGSVKIN